MNILMTLSQLEVTGAETYAVTLAENLIDRGHRVFILSDTLTKPTRAEFTTLALNKRSFARRISHVRFVRRFIREREIDLVHAHSRASGWVAYFAARLAGVPLVTSVHGRQPTHFSRKLVKAFGDAVLPVCEAIRDNIVGELGVNPRAVAIARNGVPVPSAPNVAPQAGDERPRITLVGRLSKEKGDLAYTILERLVAALDGENGDGKTPAKRVAVRVVGGRGKDVPEKFRRFDGRVEFTGYVDDVPARLADSDVVIGAGRSAIEGILMNKPVIAVGEALLHGFVTRENLPEALASNFGDIAPENRFEWERFGDEVWRALAAGVCDPQARAVVEREFAPERLADNVVSAYQTALALRLRREMPILTYHRVVRSAAEGGKLPIYTTVEQLEEHFQCLKERGFEPTTFAELARRGAARRFELWRERGKKPVILTFDDGYEDNYTLLFPLLAKYGFKATIFLVAERSRNDWDSEAASGLPPLPLLNAAQTLEMARYGVEFGSHTLSHPHLTRLKPDEARREIERSKSALEERLSGEIQALCYPYGDANETVKRLTREAGYRYGVASDSGPPFFHQDPYEIRRIGVFPATRRRSFLRKIAGDYVFRKAKTTSELVL